MRFHWQNLNEKSRDRVGAIWRHGRAWGWRLRWEWLIFRSRPGVSFSFERLSDAVGGHFEIPWLLTLYVHFETKWKSRPERQFNFYIHDGAIHFQPWGPSMDWNSRDPWWKRGVHWRIKDILFGRAKFQKETLSESSIVIPMPEGSYEATMKRERTSWKRPRLPWPSVREDSWIDVHGGIPFEGKGENSWDCGGDALFGTGCNGHREEDAVAAVVRAVLHNRRRHGTTSEVRNAGVVWAKDRVTKAGAH